MSLAARQWVLNAGSGSANAARIHSGFLSPGWKEVRLDIDPSTAPEIVASICDMREVVSDASMDAVWSSHTIEHLHAHEVIPAFREMHRVLKPDGFALLTCPDLAAIAGLAAIGDVERVVYISPAGPIRVIDMLFGHGHSIANGNFTMAHNTGFTSPRLARVALASGFAEVRVVEGPHYDLWAALLMPKTNFTRLESMFAGTNVHQLFQTSSAPADVKRVAAFG